MPCRGTRWLLLRPCRLQFLLRTCSTILLAPICCYCGVSDVSCSGHARS
jgi:hypothetical protein